MTERDFRQPLLKEDNLASGASYYLRQGYLDDGDRIAIVFARGGGRKGGKPEGLPPLTYYRSICFTLADYATRRRTVIPVWYEIH